MPSTLDRAKRGRIFPRAHLGGSGKLRSGQRKLRSGQHRPGTAGGLRTLQTLLSGPWAHHSLHTYNTPLVLGTASLRGSLSAAIRMARAVALNTASEI